MDGKSCASTSDDNDLREIRNLLWGPTIINDVFKRWSQGNWDPFCCVSIVLCLSF